MDVSGTCKASVGPSLAYGAPMLSAADVLDGKGSADLLRANRADRPIPAGVVAAAAVLFPVVLLAALAALGLITAAVRYLLDKYNASSKASSSSTAAVGTIDTSSNEANSSTAAVGPGKPQQTIPKFAAVGQLGFRQDRAFLGSTSCSGSNSNSGSCSAAAVGLRHRHVCTGSCAKPFPTVSTSTTTTSSRDSILATEQAAAAAAAAAALPVPPVASPVWSKQVKAAAGTGNTARLHVLLAAAANSSSSSSSRGAVLLEALADALWQQQPAAVIQLLLDAGASATAATDSSDNTPLHIAARQGCAAAAKALLGAGARPRATNIFLQTPLHSAAAFGHAAVAKQLLLQGAVVDAATRDGATALTEAVQGNHAAVATLLLSHGADPLLADVNLRTPLYWAAILGSQKIVQALCDQLPAAAAAAAASVHAADAAAAAATSSRWSALQVVSALRSCAMAAFSHNKLPMFAVLIKEFARRDAKAIPRLFEALGAHSSSTAAAAVAVAWAEDVTQQDRQRAELREWASDVVAERMAAQQLLLAVAGAAKHLEQQWPGTFGGSSGVEVGGEQGEAVDQVEEGVCYGAQE